jgi:hypothetical protein
MDTRSMCRSGLAPSSADRSVDWVASTDERPAVGGPVPVALPQGEAANVSAAIDALLARGELTGLTRSPLAQREAHRE